MRKLGIITHNEEAGRVTGKEFDRFLVTTMQPRHFAALRDIFPAGKELTDDELLMMRNAITNGYLTPWSSATKTSLCGTLVV